MKQEFLELKKPLQALSEGLTVMVLETVDSLYAHQREDSKKTNPHKFILEKSDNPHKFLP